MPALRELQTRFHDAILLGEPAEEGLLACLVESGEVGRRRIAVYRHSIFGKLVDALLATYPVLARIVGLPFFRAAAQAYVRQYPSESGDLNEYGEQFAEFIATWPHGRELAYLPDVARVEWQVQQVYYAAEATADLSVLAACPPQEYGTLRFTLAPAFVRMDSALPLADIWRVNAADYCGDMAVDFSVGARLLLRRANGQVLVETVGADEAAFIDALAAAASLETATTAALAADADFDLGAGLARFIGNGILVGAWRPELDSSGEQS